MNPWESWGKGGAGWGEEGMEMIQMRYKCKFHIHVWYSQKHWERSRNLGDFERASHTISFLHSFYFLGHRVLISVSICSSKNFSYQEIQWWFSVITLLDLPGIWNWWLPLEVISFAPFPCLLPSLGSVLLLLSTGPVPPSIILNIESQILMFSLLHFGLSWFCYMGEQVRIYMAAQPSRLLAWEKSRLI